MRKLLPLAAAILTLMLPRIVNAAQAPLGFTPAQAKEQLQREADYDSSLNAENLRKWSREMTTRPHHLGSPKAKENAEFVADLFRKWGYETEIEVFHVLFPTPKTRELSLLRPYPFKASLTEQIVKTDSAAAALEKEALPPYNAYSGDGEVVGALVYVNQGLPRDYEVLDRHGIDIKGKIVIARYGGSWRGIKPKVAAQHGAIATLIYSDPRDDGYFQGDVYPDGPYRMAQSAQRGSVEDMPQYPGDPLTPGVGATLDAERYTVEESPTIMKIPVLPISYEDAQPILEAMGGPVAPAAWRGALPLTYHLGPGPARVHMKLAFNWDLTPAYDVIAMLPGSEFPDEWVVRGNHMDGWAFGAGDPLSGMVALMEEARSVGEMVKNGWRPKRTIVYAGWDAEEPGLLGSTEWAEDHAAEIQEKAVVYINSDGNGRGFIGVGGSHTLERLANELGDEVIDPQTGISVNDRLKHARAVDGAPDVYTRRDRRIGPLGSGSDYTPFLQHLGIASLNIGFGGESGGGSYHSIFDSYDHYSRFGDPGFAYGITLAKTAGRATLRMANADVLPFRFGNFADNVRMYLGEVKQLAASMRTETELHNRLVENDSYEIASDPTKTYVPPEAKEPVPHINFAPVENAVARLEAAAARYDELMTSAVSQGLLGGGTGERLNNLLQGMEQRMTREEGLPRRPWFRHMIYAPGFWTGYGVKTLPGIREGLEERAWDEVDMFVDEVAAALNRVSDGLDQAAALLSAAEPG